jgi:MoaA/NifB/PqqE/SkfB family radical SAM enzyme
MCVVTFSWEDTDAIEKTESFRKKESVSWAVVELTNACNFNCKWCYASSSSAISTCHRTMQGRLSASYRTQMSGRSHARRRTSDVSSSEVFHKEARDNGMVVHMNTNGYFMTSQTASDLSRLGLSQVQINVDSMTPVKHDS